MGVPVVNAPCEAEAQCAELAKKKKVFATGQNLLPFHRPNSLIYFALL